MRLSRLQTGLSLIEILIVIAIVSVVMTITAPNVVQMQRQLAIKGATENIYFMLQLAKSTAIRQSNTILVDANLATTGDWCVGITDTGNCDCSAANSCTIDNVEHVVSSDDFSKIVLQNINFDANDQALFDGIRGMATNGAASVELTDSTNEVRINIAATGRVSLCNVTGDVGGYDGC